MKDRKDAVEAARSGELLIAVRPLPVIEMTRASSFHEPDPEIWLRPVKTAQQ